jgi:molybdenum cofactor cytidylyltransferase
MEPARSAARFSCGVIILAAGASSRMGKPKLLLPWEDTSVLGHLIHQWQELRAEQIAAVHAIAGHNLSAELDRLGFPAINRIANPQPDRGMFSSIQCAARWNGWTTALTHWAIVLGDQPHLRIETLRTLLDFAAVRTGNICQPSHHSRPCHPVILPKAVFAQLKDSSDATLKQFLRRAGTEPALCEMDDAGLDFDMDTPADYEQAVRMFGKASG